MGRRAWPSTAQAARLCLDPRVRGADTGTHAPTGWGRSSTPACAGLTLSPDHPVVNDRLYPRVRGADWHETG